MWVIYNKKDLTIAGFSADCEPDLEKDFALAEVVRGLINAAPLKEYDALQVTERKQARLILEAPRELVSLRQGAKGKLKVVVEDLRHALLVLSSDAPDVHPADGIPEIKADGVSFTTITIRKVDQENKPLEGKDDTDLLYLRTDYGTLFTADGKKEISSIKLSKGQGRFRLVSEKARRVATVQVFNADAGLLDRTIRIEFI